MKLVVNVRLSKEDIDAIQEGLENPEKAIEKIMITELSDIKDEFIRDHVSALGWMVANN